MADISILSRIVNGVVRQVDLSTNTLVVDIIKVGGGAGTNLTKTILDNLITLQSGSDVAASLHHHDGRYFTETELGSATGSSGSDLIGDDATYSNFTPAAATVKGALSGIDTALGAASGTKVKISATDTLSDYLDPSLSVDNGSNTTNPLEKSIQNPGANETLRIRFDQSKVDHGSIAGLGDDDHTQYHNDARGDARYYQKTEFVTTATAGAPVKLDGAGKIAIAQLPSAIMTYEGVWSASTNSPSLADGVGDTGMVYRVGTAGTQNLGSGSIVFDVGDYVIYNGTIWEKSDTTDAVASVFGRTGIVTAQNGDYTASQVTNVPAGGIAAVTVQAALNELDSEKFNSADFNSTFDTRLGTKSTTDLAEGTNLYFTDERAQDAIGSALTDSATVDFTYNDGANTITADVLSAPLVKKTLVSGETTLAANTSFLVRWALNGETAGRIYKADKDASTSDKFWCVGIAHSTSAVSAGGNVDVTVLGTHVLGSSDTPFNATDIGKAVWLTAAGAFSVTAPTGANEAAFKIGTVQSTTSIWVDKQMLGVN